MNTSDDERGTSGIEILWPDTANTHFKEALAACDAGKTYNNTSAVIRYSLEGGASFMWLGDLDNEFMEDIADDIRLEKTTVVFAAHHGRNSGASVKTFERLNRLVCKLRARVLRKEDSTHVDERVFPLAGAI